MDNYLLSGHRDLSSLFSLCHPINIILSPFLSLYPAFSTSFSTSILFHGILLSSWCYRRDIKAQMQIAALMPLRLVDQHGKPVYARGARSDKSVTSYHGLQSDGGLGKREDEMRHSSEFGSIVPYEASITLGGYIVVSHHTILYLYLYLFVCPHSHYFLTVLSDS